MPVIRGTFFFEQNGYGWTESLWLNGSSSDLGTYLPIMDRLAQKRILLSGKQTYLTFLRASAEGVFRDALTTGYPGDGLQGKSTQDSDPPDTCLLLTMTNTPFSKHKKLFLRGIWDTVVTLGGQFTPTATYLGYLNSYKAQLIADAWGWLGVDTAVNAAISAVTSNVSGSVHITTATDLFPGPYPLDTSVRISGVQGAASVNGLRRVRATDARTMDTRDRIPIFTYTAGTGRARFTTKNLILITRTSGERIGERKAGRPSFKSAGRRKGRALA